MGKSLAFWRSVPLLSVRVLSGILGVKMKGKNMSVDSPQTETNDVQVETLIEDVSIDGMCGVY